MYRIADRLFPCCNRSGNIYDSPYSDLAAGIVLQAAKDYINVLCTIWDSEIPVAKKRRSLVEKIEIENFFYSGWYDTLCDISPDKIIYNCRIKAAESL